MNEAQVKRAMVEDVRKAGGYARRYEDQFGVGIPDTLFVLKGLPPIFAEIKVFKHVKFGPTDRQWVELMRINAHQPQMFGVVIGWKDGVYYFHEAEPTILSTDCFSVTHEYMSFAGQLRQFYHARLMCQTTEK